MINQNLLLGSIGYYKSEKISNFENYSELFLKQLKPLITIITVTYNAENVIEKTLKSVKQQSFTDFEYMVIDGSSSDQTLKKVKAANIPDTVIKSEPDKGLYDAMNKGLRMAKGDYIIFLNAGDAFHSPDTLSEYAREADEGKEIIYGDTVIVDKEGNILGSRHLTAPQNLTKDSFSKGMLICHQAFMVKKNIAPEYDMKYRFSADYDWCVKCINKVLPEKCINLQAVTIDYLSDGLTDKNKMKSLKERFQIMAKHYGFTRTFFNHIGFLIRAFKRGKI